MLILKESPFAFNLELYQEVHSAAKGPMCSTACENILASENISLKLFIAPLETIELLTFCHFFYNALHNRLLLLLVTFHWI